MSALHLSPYCLQMTPIFLIMAKTCFLHKEHLTTYKYFKWLKVNKLSLNLKKTMYMIFTPPKKKKKNKQKKQKNKQTTTKKNNNKTKTRPTDVKLKLIMK